MDYNKSMNKSDWSIDLLWLIDSFINLFIMKFWNLLIDSFNEIDSLII